MSQVTDTTIEQRHVDFIYKLSLANGAVQKVHQQGLAILDVQITPQATIFHIQPPEAGHSIWKDAVEFGAKKATNQLWRAELTAFGKSIAQLVWTTTTH